CSSVLLVVFARSLDRAMCLICLHDALPISPVRPMDCRIASSSQVSNNLWEVYWAPRSAWNTRSSGTSPRRVWAMRSARSTRPARSEEHTSELQSRFDLVCRLQLDKKKNRE